MKLNADIITLGNDNYFGLSTSMTDPDEIGLSGLIIDAVVGEDVLYKDLVYFNFENLMWHKASNTNINKMPARALILEDTTSNGVCPMLLFGAISNEVDYSGTEQINRTMSDNLIEAGAGVWEHGLESFWQRTRGSSVYQGLNQYHYFRVSDNSWTNQSYCFYPTGDAQNSASAYMTIEIPHGKIVKQLGLRARAINGSQAPRGFRVKGRIAGTQKWKLIYDAYTENDSAIGLSFSNGELKTFDMDNPNDIKFDAVSLYDIQFISLHSVIFYDHRGVDMLPVWESNESPDGYTLDAYPYYNDPTYPANNWVPWRALQKNNPTEDFGWYTAYHTSSNEGHREDVTAGENYSPFIDFNFSHPFKLTEYGWYPRHDGSSWNAWKLWGSVDHGVNWTLLDDRNDITHVPDTEQRFHIENETAYNRYRFRRYPVKDGGGGGHGIGEIKLYQDTPIIINGPELYVSETGNLTTVKPSSPNSIIQNIGNISSHYNSENGKYYQAVYLDFCPVTLTNL